ncbi:hypothetical protein K435DRAFT_809993, partial [Dendrothele bispora CBS 962.96]
GFGFSGVLGVGDAPLAGVRMDKRTRVTERSRCLIGNKGLDKQDHIGERPKTWLGMQKSRLIIRVIYDPDEEEDEDEGKDGEEEVEAESEDEKFEDAMEKLTIAEDHVFQYFPLILYTLHNIDPYTELDKSG